ncbi:hypothetical protein KNE206_29800 [Kitasatospora sp. NE20-6]|uniref:AAA family ATPase n=1 Tax=Kitasatospora sp. NE20-6 TaxID=2859066 RepID=UPI0034DB8F65
MSAPGTPHASDSHPAPAGASTVELFPVNFTAYRHHPHLKTEQHVQAIADLLAPYGLHLTPWDTPPHERDRQAAEDRLSSWTGTTASSSRGNTVLYWVGHGSADSLAHHRTPAPIGGGVSAHDIADAIGSRQVHPDAADSWAIVVLDACFSRRFARTVHAELLTRYPSAGRYLLLSTAAEGYAELGDFTPALDRALTVTFRGQPAIGLATLGGQLAHDLGGYRGDTVDDHYDKLVRLLPDAATAVSAPLDQLAEIQAVIDRLPVDEQRHFLPKAAGAEIGELAWYFHGRTLERDRILHWLTTAAHGALVVTGPAGAGKSALLGHILLHSRTHLREVLVRHGHLQPLPAGTPCPDHPFDLVTHLSGLTLTRTIQLIAQAADLPDLAQQATDGRPPADLAARLITQLRTRQVPLTLLFDALDEAEQPLTIADTLLRPLAALPTVRVVIGTRRSTHEGPDQPAPADTDILDALRPRPTSHGAGPVGGHEAWPEGHVQCVEVTRDPEALAGYLRAKLDAAKRRGALDADDTHIADAVRRLVTDHHHDGAEPQQFLYVRLAAHELLNDPRLITDPGPLIGRTHRQLFTRALERLHRTDPAYTPLLRALGLAQGRGLPDQDGIWARAADALTPTNTPADTGSSIPGLLRDAAPYLVLDQEYDRSVYRLAHRTFTEHFTTAPDTPQAHALLTTALTHHARHTLETPETHDSGTITPPPPAVSPYIRHHLAAHARLGHTAGALDLLADHPDVLDTLDLASITAAALNYGLPSNALPPAIAGTVLLQHEAQGSTVPDQSGGSATGWRRWWRRLGTTYIDGTPPSTETHTHNPGEWPPALIVGSVQRRQLHLQLTGHTDWVTAVAVFTAEDGSPRLATGSVDKTVRIWNPATGAQDGEPLTGHTGGVRTVAVFTAEDGSPRLATGDSDGMVRIWNPATGAQDGEPLTGHTGWVRTVAVFTAEDGSPRLATGGDDTNVLLWNPATGAQDGEPLTGHTGWVRTVAVFTAEDGSPRLATGSEDKTVLLWNPVTGAQDGEPLTGHTGGVGAVAVFTAEDGSPRLATGGDWTVRIWNPATSTHDGEPHTGGVGAVAVFMAEDGSPRLATGGSDGTVRIWNPVTGAQDVEPLTGHTGGVGVVTVFMAEDGSPRLATGGSDGTVRIWNPATGAQDSEPLTGHTDGVGAVAVFTAEDGRQRLATSSDGTVRIWNPATGTQDGAPLTEDDDWVRSMAVFTAEDGSPRLAIGGYDGIVRIWNPATGTNDDLLFTGHTGWVGAVAVFTAEDGSPRLATSGYDGTVRLWNPRAPEGHTLPLADPVHALAAGHGLLAAGTRAGFLAVDISSVQSDLTNAVGPGSPTSAPRAL